MAEGSHNMAGIIHRELVRHLRECGCNATQYNVDLTLSSQPIIADPKPAMSYNMLG